MTLTYDDQHVPTMDLDGVSTPCTRSEDIRKFNMDIRKRFQQGFYLDYTLQVAGMATEPARIALPQGTRYKYYIVSEYGPETKRPHYHGFFSSLPDDEDLVFDLFQSMWGKGFITCEKGKSEACAAYVSKYLVNHSLVPVDERLPKPRAWMSKGLGSTYLDSDVLVDWHRSAPLQRQFCMQNGRRTILPRYYRDRLFDDDMKAQILEDCVSRDEAEKRHFGRLSPYEQTECFRRRIHEQEEAVRQAEWHFRKNGKLK